MPTDYGDRFLAKVALGLGALMLNESFRTSDAAALLRKAMWTRTAAERAQIPIHGTGFLGTQMGQVQRFLSWPGGHTLAWIITGATLNLYVCLYEEQEAVIQVSSDPEHWRGSIKQEGQVHVIAPGLQRAVGPKSLARYLGYKIGDIADTELGDLMAECNRFATLPPFDL